MTIIATLRRLAGVTVKVSVFAAFCFFYWMASDGPMALRSRGQRRAFVGLALSQFLIEGCHRVVVGGVVLRSTMVAAPSTSPRLNPFKSPRRVGSLLFAEGLKAEGFFDDAEHLYRMLARDRATQWQANLALADMILLQARWASEFKIYERRGHALDVSDVLVDLKGRPTWRTRTAAEAVNILTEMKSERNTDVRRILADAYLAEDRFQDALNVLTENDGTVDPNCRAIADEARFALALAPSASCTMMKIVATAELRDQVRQRTSVAGTETLAIASTVVGRGDVRAVVRSITFGAQQLVELDDARILPPYGAVSVGDQLLVDAFHLDPVHYPAFCTAILATNHDRALVANVEPAETIELGCYIGSNENYFHFLLEDLPRLRHVLDADRYSSAPILVDRAAQAWQLELLSLFGVDRSRMRFVDFSSPLLVQRLILPPRLSKNLVTHPADLAFVRRRLLGATTHRSKPGRRIYIARAPGKGRALLDRRRVEARFKRAGFQIIRPELMSIADQVALFADAEAVAGPGGAGFANLAFAPADTKVIVLGTEDPLSETFSSIASALGQSYWWCVGPSAPRPHRLWLWTRFNFAIADDDLTLCLAASGLETAPAIKSGGHSVTR